MHINLVLASRGKGSFTNDVQYLFEDKKKFVTEGDGRGLKI